MSPTRMPRAAVCIALVVAVAGCHEPTAILTAPSALPASSGPPAPAPPAPAPPTASTLVDVTLSGRVYEVVSDSPRTTMGIAGVSVYCEQCGESTHTFTATDANGEYLFPRGVWDEARPSFPIRILVTKEGYGDPPGLPRPTPPNPSGPGWREVVIHGDTRFEIELRRR